MKYTILYTKSSVENIQKLDIVSKKRLKKKIEEYLIDPLHYAKRLIHSSIGMYRWRVGNYRIVFDLVDKNIIIILRIGHRKEIYR